ncbi:MAG: D-alanyl-D-alanine carboxypeptidase [Oscillospiraceae bacterium]|nr:D-alanyl-D-alanine carboxypeptidase [Oscillospiraceae bacterium]
MKKLVSVLLVTVIFISCFCISSNASFNSLLETEADIVLLINTDSETVIFDKNADKHSAPASLTKIVTCMLTLENCEDLNTQVTCKSESLNGLYAQNAATVGILAGETLTVNDLLHCLMIPSAADAANILADFIGGSIDEFVVMMNDFVKNLGCENTHFINPHGLDSGGGAYTTAYDLYKITKYALQNPTFKEITGTVKYQIGPTNKYPHIRYLNTTVKMMNSAYKDYYLPEVSGVKTGTTDAAGHCVITTASKSGYNYMLIVMNAPQYDIDGDGVEENVAFTDSKKIYEWAFEHIVLTKVTSTTDVVTVIDIKYNWNVDHLRLVPAKEISTLVPTGTESGSLTVRPIESETPQTVNAPVQKGDILGKAEVLYGEEVVATVDLAAAESVSRSFTLWVFSGIKTVFSSPIFLILFALVVLMIVIYILLIIRKNRIKAKRRKIKMVKG